MRRPSRLALFVSMIAMSGMLSAEDDVEFNRDIRPLLSEKCFSCHGPDESHREADLRLDIESDAKQNAITAGNADQSELIARLISDDLDTKMPPPESQQSLSDEEINRIKRWIDQGAAYQGHWSFIPPQKSSLPNVDRQDVDRQGWASNPIDRLVLETIRDEGLDPSPRADRADLIRRLSLDLIGLPPTVETVQQFVNDDGEDAYEKVVDQLLESQHYGEHMARYWLDAARYADTNGYQYDLEREQWVWRDWVIAAFNSSMPFDQFTIEQIAGDKLPDATDQQRLATGFNRNHPITIEGGVIDEEYRTEYVVDRVVTTSTVWLGLTIGCCRCHDHKYDPISQREFYEFFAFFNNVAERGLNGFDPKRKIVSPLAGDQVNKLDNRIATAKAELEQLAREDLPVARWVTKAIDAEQQSWSIAVPGEMKSTNGTELTIQADNSILASGPNPANETFELVLESSARPVGALQLEAFPDPTTQSKGAGRGSNGNFVLSEIEVDVATAAEPDEFRKVELASAEADHSQANYDVAFAIDGKVDNTGWAVDGHSRKEQRTARFHFREPLQNDPGMRIRVRLIHRYGGSHHIARFRLSLFQSDQSGIPLAIAAQLRVPESEQTAEQKQEIKELLISEYGSAEAKSVTNRLRDARSERQELVSSVPATLVMADRKEPRKTHVLLRGEYDNPGEEVSAGTPAALPEMKEELPRNRLGLARWLVQPDNPLTARVAVNRFWQQLFGNGLVKSTEDFGAQGDWPSHPELLDWLAVEFVESGWDVKSLIKTMVMSATYQQSAKLTPASLQRDPENRLLARGPRLRLDAEVIRDSALQVSDLLNGQIGGPSVFPYHPTGLWQEINNRPGYSRTYKQDAGQKLYRRSLYTFWKRTVPPPSMASFDAPERETCRVRRSRTNTPLQALVLLHDPQFVEAARHLASRMISAGGDEDEQRIDYGFGVCYSRIPTDAERQALKKILVSRRDRYGQHAKSAATLVAVGDSITDAGNDPIELAAWTSVARTMMNLSEFVTKP